MMQPAPEITPQRVLFYAAMLLLVTGVCLMSESHSEAAQHDAALKNDDGSWKYTNALIDQTSPYLLQHAHNPVDWHPWGEEAFELSRKLNKPIFLSVGYSTCYWCHVMERQVFENPKIAALMNELFINVKVDREERPDVDDLYMAAVQLMTRSGGWPMSVFLTPPGAAGDDDPGLKPFYAGTYFPPEPMHGRPSFPQVITQLSEAWNTSNAEVVEQAQRVAEAVTDHLSKDTEAGELTVALVQDTASQMLRMYDQTHGGFGSAPKFPQPANLAFLQRVQQNNPNDDLNNAIAHTLDRMARGGMYDQIGGGFHRYSTDERWLVPHFEKMLYDNGQLLEVYATAHRMGPPKNDPEFYARVMRETCEYVLREMVDDTGSFWSAQDAEVDAKEGDNYVWLANALGDAIGDGELTKLAGAMYGFMGGPNFRDPHDPQAVDVNVLYLPKPLHELADELDITLAQLLEQKHEIDQRMLAVRDQRKQPSTDDKVIVSWNGMMIAGFAAAGRTLDEPRYVQAAERAADYILKNMRTEQGQLHRTMRDGKIKIDAFLEDYTLFAHGLIELHHAQTDKANDHWLNAAREITDIAIKLFHAEHGGYYDTLPDQSDLFVRAKSSYDGAIVSGNSQMIHNLVDLYELTNDEKYLSRAIDDLGSFGLALKRQSVGMVHMQHALLKVLEIAPQQVTTFNQQIEQGGDDKAVVQATLSNDVIELANRETQVTLTLQIADGYHINADKVTIDGLVPTTVSLDSAAGVKLTASYPKPALLANPLGDDPMPAFEGKVVITLRFTGSAANDNANGNAKLAVHYQACTDSECLAPTTLHLPVKIVNRDNTDD